MVALRQLFHQRRPQQSEALPEMAVRLVPEQRLLVVWVDQLRLHLQMDLPQPVVAEETVAMARQRRAATAEPEAQLWSIASPEVLQLAVPVAPVARTDQPAVPAVPQQQLVAVPPMKAQQDYKYFRYLSGTFLLLALPA